MMDEKQEIIQIIDSLSGGRSPYEIYCDWIKCCALSIQNSAAMFQHNSVWNKREQEYANIIKNNDGREFTKMFGLLQVTLEKEISDALGEIYMESKMGNKNTGQFFTPFHISELAARVALEGMDFTKPIILNEPSCGGGGMIIAAVKILKEKGINYHNQLKVVAQDLDWKAVYMCYIQLSILGVNAIVIQGNALSCIDFENYPKEQVWYTPVYMGVV